MVGNFHAMLVLLLLLTLILELQQRLDISAAVASFQVRLSH